MDREQQQQTEREQEKKQADECNLSLQKEKLSLQSSLDSALAEQQKLTTQYTGLINTTKKVRYTQILLS